MRTPRKLASFVLAATVSVAAAGCGGDGAASETQTIRVGHVIADSSPLHAGAEEFERIVEEESDGRLQVEVFPAGQLGDEADMIQQVASGALDVVLASPAVISNTYPDAAIFAMPFVLDGEDEKARYNSLRTVGESDVVQEMTEEMASEKGLRAVDWTWWYGDRHITNSVRPIKSPDDLDGLKLRTPDAPIHFLALKQLGASVTPLAFSELYLALQTGTVDGQENPTSTIETSKFYEVQEHLALTGHMSQAEVFLYSEEIWANFSDSDQELLTDAAERAGEFQSEKALAENTAALGRLKEQGLAVTSIDQETLRSATEGAAEAWAADNNGFSLERYQRFVDAN